MAKKKLTAGALFSGIGGFCLGFKKQDIETLWAVEQDIACVSTYQANLGHGRVIGAEIGPAKIEDVSVRGSKLQPVDVLHAGFPCQSFSGAGERTGFKDPRGQLFYHIIRIIKEFGDDRPSVLVLENSPHLRYGDGGRWFLELCNEVKKAGYWFRESNSAELDAYDFTPVPQKRNRLFMVAFSTNAFSSGRFEFPRPTRATPKNLTSFINFSGSLDDDSYYLDKENRYYKMITKEIDDPLCIYQLRKFLVRAKEPGVCPTLTANMGLGGHNVPFVMDAKGLRKLTEYECLRLQGFPKGFKFPNDVPRAKRYTQIGNSVVPLVAELLAMKIKEKILGERNNG